MITRKMLKQAYEADIVELINSPNGDGTVCRIGEDWFYFDSDHGGNYLAADYEKEFDTEFTLAKIYERLEEMRENPDLFSNEYDYCESYIREHLIPSDANVDLMKIAANKITELLDWIYRAKCEYYIMDDEYLSQLAYPELSHDNHGNRLIKGCAYMIITVSNGYKYYVNVTADSVLTACAEVFNFIQNKI